MTDCGGMSPAEILCAVLVDEAVPCGDHADLFKPSRKSLYGTLNWALEQFLHKERVCV